MNACPTHPPKAAYNMARCPSVCRARIHPRRKRHRTDTAGRCGHRPDGVCRTIRRAGCRSFRMTARRKRHRAGTTGRCGHRPLRLCGKYSGHMPPVVTRRVRFKTRMERPGIRDEHSDSCVRRGRCLHRPDDVCRTIRRAACISFRMTARRKRHRTDTAGRCGHRPLRLCGRYGVLPWIEQRPPAGLSADGGNDKGRPFGRPSRYSKDL